MEQKRAALGYTWAWKAPQEEQKRRKGRAAWQTEGDWVLG